jgi:hypothetical protein
MVNMPDERAIEQLIAVVNVELEAGNWSAVATLTVELYQRALAVGDQQFAELVQDLHWIANDAVAHPLDTAAMVQP